MAELLQTERAYVKDLEECINYYLKEMKNAPESELPAGIVGHHNIIFGNIEEIHQFHKKWVLFEKLLVAKRCNSGNWPQKQNIKTMPKFSLLWWPDREADWLRVAETSPFIVQTFPIFSEYPGIVLSKIIVYPDTSPLQVTKYLY